MAADDGRRFDAVVFDFSGVMVGSAFEVMASVLGDHLPHREAVEFMLGPYDRDTDHPWHRVERGEADMASWMQHIDSEATERGFTLDWGALRTAFAALPVHDEMVDCVRRIRAEGYRTALLTNNVREGSGTWRSMIPVDELFDVVVDSSEVGLRKPDPRIYRLTLERLGGVPPQRAVFLDDHPGNVAGAEAAGLSALLVVDPIDAVTALDVLLTGAASGAQ